MAYKDLEDGRIHDDPEFPPEDKKPLTPKGFDSKNLDVSAKMFLAIGQPRRPIPTDDANWFELIGTVGQCGKYFSIYKWSESQKPYKADDWGELYGLVNDYPTDIGITKGCLK